jgi:hypothetical protein
MNQLFLPYLRKFILFFFDDILIYSKTWKKHMKHLEQLLSLLEKNQFYAKLSKCSFGKEEVEYLGHVISREGVKVDTEKSRQSHNGPNQRTYQTKGIPWINRLLSKIYQELHSFNNTLVKLIKEKFLQMG